MDALLTINAGPHVTDTTVPEKGPRKHEEKFGKVLNEKERRQEPQPERKVTGKRSEPAKRSEGKQCQQTSEVKQQSVEQAEIEKSVLGEAEEGFQPIVATPDIFSQQMNVAVSDGEEISADIKIQPVDQIEPLKVAVDEVADETIDEVLLDESVVSLPEQPVEVIIIPQIVTDQAVGAVIEAQQQGIVTDQVPVKVKPIRQQVAESIVAATDSEVEAVLSKGQIAATVPNDDVDVTVEDLAEKVDPRFAELLKPRAEKQPVQQLQPIKESAQLHGSRGSDVDQTESIAPVLAEGVEPKQGVEPAPLTGLSTKQVLEQLAQPGHSHLQSSGQVQTQGLDAVKAMPQTPMVQLSNGYQVSESQIFDQVVTQLSGSANGESGRMVLRLQPAELGSLRLELKIEGDRVQAHLHAQTHQVQEVLERNLPQLRSALAEQGLKIDQFLVNVDQRQAEGQFDGQTQYQQQGAERQSDRYPHDHDSEEQMIPLAHLMQNGGGGISLHV
jgi:flagellar hook-length control protein FliK